MLASERLQCLRRQAAVARLELLPDMSGAVGVAGHRPYLAAAVVIRGAPQVRVHIVTRWIPRFDICPVDHYSVHIIEVIRSGVFDEWLSGLRDRRAMVRIAVRLDRPASGNPGDTAPVGGGVSELRIDYGPGYRVYFLRRGPSRAVLPCGGEKASQGRDIRKARSLAGNWKD